MKKKSFFQEEKKKDPNKLLKTPAEMKLDMNRKPDQHPPVKEPVSLTSMLNQQELGPAEQQKLWDEWSAAMRRYVSRILDRKFPFVRHKRLVDTSDAMQVTFWKLLNQWENLEPEHTQEFLQYSKAVVRKYLVDERKAMGHRKNGQAENLNREPLDQQELQLRDANAFTVRQIEWMIETPNKFSEENPELAAVLFADQVFGRSEREIADKMRVSAKTARERIRKAREWLVSQGKESGLFD